MSNVASSSHFPMASVVYSTPGPKGATESIATPLLERGLFLQIQNICKNKLLKRELDWNLACILWDKFHTHEIMMNTGLSALQTIVQSDDCLLFDLTQQQRLLWISIEFSNAKTPMQSASIILAGQVQVYTFHLESDQGKFIHLL